MRKALITRSIIISLLFIFSFGCLPETKKEKVGMKPVAISPPPLPADMLDKKIAYLTHILEDKGLQGKDREIALNLLAAYETLRSESRNQTHGYDYHKIIHTLFTALSRVDEKYFLKGRIDKKEYTELITLFSSKKKKVLDRYLSEDYQGVINGCLELASAFGPDSLTPEIGLLFAISLARKGMLKDAINIAERISPELVGRPDLIRLRANIIEWQLDLGNREKALAIYEKLIDDTDELDAILKRADQMLRGEERIVARPEKISSEDYSTHEKGLHESDPMKGLLREVDALIQRDAFREAKLLLIKERIKAQEGPDIETIDQALKSVELAEERFQKKGEAHLNQEEEILNLARRLIEEDDFEGAIAKLGELGDGRDRTPESTKLKDLAVERLINRDRNKAAKIFLMAKKAIDPIKREELLLTSYKILKALIDKYPSSNLINKLNDHIRTVRKELGKLGKDPGQ